VTDSFQQILPDPGSYRRELVAAGAIFPLAEVPRRADGLLAAIPAPPAGAAGWPWDRETPPFAASAPAWPKITIVIPSFQQGAFLEETLRSVLLQNYPLLECIVIDGGSSDESPAILQRYRPWLSYVRVAPDRGQGHAINLGFSVASGAIFGWINSDDFYLPGALRRVAEAWRRGSEFLYGEAIELDQATGKRRYAASNPARARYTRFAGLLPSHASFWPAARHRPLWEEQHCALDYELWIRLLPGLRVRHIAWPLAAARYHDDAKTHSPVMRRQWEEDARRNGLAHPELYRAGFGGRLLAREFFAARSLCRRWRRRGLRARLETLRRECGWTAAPDDRP
jgi:glycosyltransferase involved in cell wall biosynthesis